MEKGWRPKQCLFAFLRIKIPVETDPFELYENRWFIHKPIPQFVLPVLVQLARGWKAFFVNLFIQFNHCKKSWWKFQPSFVRLCGRCTWPSETEYHSLTHPLSVIYRNIRFQKIKVKLPFLLFSPHLFPRNLWRWPQHRWWYRPECFLHGEEKRRDQEGGSDGWQPCSVERLVA